MKKEALRLPLDLDCGNYRLFSFRMPNTRRKRGARRAGVRRTTIFMESTFLSFHVLFTGAVTVSICAPQKKRAEFRRIH